MLRVGAQEFPQMRDRAAGLNFEYGEGKWRISDLRDFLKKLDKEGELRRISAEVDPVLEITEISDRVVKSGGPALLFERPRGSRFPAVTNLVGSERRMNLALEVESLDEVAERILGFWTCNRRKDCSTSEDAAETGGVGIVVSEDGEAAPCKEVVRTEDFSLLDFPILQCWPQDGGTLHHLADGDHKESGDGKAKRGLLPHAGFRFAHHGHALADAEARRGAFSQRARRRTPDGKLEVAVAIGADPATCLAGILPVPPDMDEFMFAGFLRREPVEMVACETVRSRSARATRKSCSKAMWSWANCAPKAPSATTPASIRSKGEYPVFHVNCITHRKRSAISDDHRGAAAARGLFISATRSSAFSCR